MAYLTEASVPKGLQSKAPAGLQNSQGSAGEYNSIFTGLILTKIQFLWIVGQRKSSVSCNVGLFLGQLTTWCLTSIRMRKRARGDKQIRNWSLYNFSLPRPAFHHLLAQVMGPAHSQSPAPPSNMHRWRVGDQFISCLAQAVKHRTMSSIKNLSIWGNIKVDSEVQTKEFMGERRFLLFRHQQQGDENIFQMVAK